MLEMRRICGAVFTLACAAGCGPRPPEESASDTAVSGEVMTNSSSSTTASGETTSSAPGMTASGEISTATGASFETCGEVTDMAVEPWPTWFVDCVDPQIDWKSEHVDCVLDCSDKTLLHGEGPAASLVLVSQITFDIEYGACYSGVLLRRLLLGHPNAPIATVVVYLECGLDPWIGMHLVKGWLADQTPFTATLTIDGYAGDWNSPDPVDPPRLFGSFSGDLVGPFEATHCAVNDTYIDGCA